MEILQATVSNRAFPPDTGGYQRIHGLVSGLDNSVSVQRYCCTGILASIYSEGKLLQRNIHIEDNIREFRDFLFRYDVPKALNELGLSRYFWTIFINRRLWNNLFNIARGKDILIGEDPYTAAALASLTDKTTVYSSHNIESERYRQTHDNILSVKMADKISDIEELACRESDLVICTTADDKNHLSKYSNNIEVIPNGVLESRLDSCATLDMRRKRGISQSDVVAVFVGTSYTPNIESCEWLIDNWEKSDIECHLLIVGSVSDDIETNHERIHKAGYVDDLSALLNEVDIGLNPVVLGSGSNIKLLDYFAAGLPVLSTPFGATGFDVSNEIELLIQEREKFIKNLNRLSRNEDLREQLGSNAYQKVKNEYLWKKLSNEYEKILRGTLHS